MTKEEIYACMTAQRSDLGIEWEFNDGKPCAELYGRVYAARVRLAERAGIGFEDRDLLEIIENLEKIGKLRALKMYVRGVQHSMR